MTIDVEQRPWDPQAEAGDGPVVCVAVATHERVEGLRILLSALAAQTLDKRAFEVVIVDDASGPQTSSVLADAREHSGLRLRTMRFEVNRGPAAARNTAWRTGTAPIVAFTDDDCNPTPTWLEEGLEAMRLGPSVLVGATKPEPTQRHLLDPLARTMSVDRATFAPTCNVFYVRRDLEAVSGFDETFTVPVGEDTDLAWRVSTQVGRELVFCADALVYHDVRVRSFKQAIRETRRWAGIPPVVARHRELARRAWYKGYFLRYSHPRALLAAVAVLWAFGFPPALLLTYPWLRYRMFPGLPSATWLRNVRFIPAALAIDLYEIYVLAKSSLRHRALML